MNATLNFLMVEDSADDAAFLVHELHAGGFDTTWKRVETEADYVANLGPHLDIVFSDFSLPRFSTHRALALLKESRLDIPFIIVSGTIGEERAVESMKAGATDYVLKDRLDRLVPAVKRALRETSERREHALSEVALRESESRFRQLAEHINEVFWITDPAKNEMLYVSPAYETIWGRTCSSLYRSPQNWLQSVHAEDRARIEQAAMSRQTAGDYDEIYRIMRPDGSLRWIRDRAFPVRNETGQTYRVVGIAEDITERRQLEEQFRQAQKMEAVGQLASGVAHDFNNLLAVIRGYADLTLASRDRNTDAESEHLNQIAIATERAANLTRQLLAFGRRQTMQPVTLDLNEVIANVVKMLDRIIGADLVLEFHKAANLPSIHADVGMIEQVLLNLAVNARDAMPHGGKLTLSTAEKLLGPEELHAHPQATAGRHICLTVADTGCGIPPEILPRIFEPFFTTKEAGKGTGLGLATVYGIVRQHHGWLTVTSTPGVGTEFRAHFPVAAVAPKKQAATRDDSGLRGGTETILVVDDEVALRTLARNVLERFGYRVMEAASGHAALEIWKQQDGQIDLLLTDMVMPGGMTGRALVEKLRAEKPSLRTIYTSGYGTDIVGKDFTLHESVNFLQKPYPISKLIKAVRDALDAAA